MSKGIYIVLLIVLLFAGVIIALFANMDHSSIEMPAESLPKTRTTEHQPKGFAVYVKAKKLTTIYSDYNSGLPKFFERELEISVSGNAFRLDKVDPAALRKEIDIFNGEFLRTITIEKGKKIAEANQSRIYLDTVEFYIKSLGLIPVLSYLADPSTKINFLERTARKEDKIDVRVGTSKFIVYSDLAGIVRKVEMGKYTMEYGDYRLIDGMRIPFITRVFSNGHLIYELIFTEINLHPVFPDEHFS